MNKCQKLLLTLFILCIAISGIMWIVASVQIQINNTTNPQNKLCSDICGSQYIYPSNKNGCCSSSSSYYSQCKSKLVCQQESDAYYSKIQNVFMYMFIGSIVCNAILIFCSCCKKEDRRANQQSYVIQQNIRSSRLSNRLLHRSQQINFHAESQQQNGIDQNLRDSFPVRSSQNICPVCFEAYDNSKALILKCGHLFHSQCIRDWAKKQNNCPLCRMDL